MNVTLCLVNSHVIICHVTERRHTKQSRVTPFNTTPLNNILRNTTPRYTILRHATRSHTTPHYQKSRKVAPDNTTSHHDIQHHTTPRTVIPHYPAPTQPYHVQWFVFRNTLLSHHDYFSKAMEMISVVFKNVSPVSNLETWSLYL